MLSKGAVSTETVLYTICTLRKYNTQTIRLTVQASLSDKDRQSITAKIIESVRHCLRLGETLSFVD